MSITEMCCTQKPEDRLVSNESRNKNRMGQPLSQLHHGKQTSDTAIKPTRILQHSITWYCCRLGHRLHQLVGLLVTCNYIKDTQLTENATFSMYGKGKQWKPFWISLTL